MRSVAPAPSLPAARRAASVRSAIGARRLASPVVRFRLLAVGILFLALGLRAYDLAGIPPELFEDEISDTVSAWSIVTTGHDIERTHLPFLVSRLEMKLPIYGLSTLVPRALFGDTVWAIRLPAVAFGVAATALLVWLMRLLGRSRAESLLAGALFASLPWAVHHGRIGLPPDALLPFTFGGLGLLWSGLRDRGTARIVGGAGVLALGAYTYTIAPLMHVLLAGVVLALHAGSLHRREWRAVAHGGALGLLLLAPYIHATLTEPFFTERSSYISVFRDGVNAASIGLAWRNYWEQWNPQWLFLSDPPNLRNHPGMALAFAWTAPFFLAGIGRLLGRKTTVDVFALLWLVLGPLPAGLTNDGVPHFTRGLLALPPFAMVTAAGLVWTWQGVRRIGWPLAGAFVAALALVATLQGITAYRFYFTDYAAVSASSWYSGQERAYRAAHAAVPTGGTLCIHEVNRHHLNFWHYVAYYLEPRDFDVVEGLSAPRCIEVGTYLLTPIDTPFDGATRTEAVVHNINGDPVYRLAEIVAPARSDTWASPWGGRARKQRRSKGDSKFISRLDASARPSPSPRR